MKTTLAIPVLSAVMIILASCGSGSSGGSGQTIGHDNLNADNIPLTVLDDIRTMDVYFEHASVGHNIMNGLLTLAGTDHIRYDFVHGETDTTLDNASDEIGTVIPAWFVAHDGFGDNWRDNPGFALKLSGFNSRLRDNDFAAALDVAMFKFCYIDDDGITDPQTSFNSVRSVMDGLEADYPGTTFVWFTMPIEIESGTDANRAAFNELMRAYCSANGKWLFDIADIESYSPDGVHQIDVDGIEFLSADYAEEDSHLNAVGQERVARAWWVLLAKIRGWY